MYLKFKGAIIGIGIFTTENGEIREKMTTSLSFIILSDLPVLCGEHYFRNCRRGQRTQERKEVSQGNHFSQYTVNLWVIGCGLGLAHDRSDTHHLWDAT